MPTADTPPAPPSAPIIVEAAADNSPQLFLGFTVFGDAATVAPLRAEAERLAVRVRNGADPKNPLLMVAFLQDGRRSLYLDFYRRAIAGQFGQLRIALVLLPEAKAKAGAGIEAAIAATPNFIVTPPVDGKQN